MKTLFLAIANIFFLVSGVAQPTMTPGVANHICPGQIIQFNFSSPHTLSIVQPIKGCTINSMAANHAEITFTDVKEEHSFKLWDGSAGQGWVMTFTAIETLDGIKTEWVGSIPPGIAPLPPDYNDALDYSGPTVACGTTTFTYTGPSVLYKNSSGAQIGYPINSYEWIAPKNWKINGTTSNGTTAIITASPSASITPDPITGGEIRMRAMNDCSPFDLKRSKDYRIKILGRDPLRVSVLGQNPLAISCPDQTAKVFTVENANQYSCITGFKWHIGSNWLYNGSPAPLEITTAGATLTLTPVLTMTPGNISANAIINGTDNPVLYTCPVSYNPCVLTISPVGVYVACSIPSTFTFSVNNVPYVSGITGYVWSFASSPIGWKDVNGNTITGTITTPVGSSTLTLTSDGGYNSPSDIILTPQINGQPATPSSSSVGFSVCCGIAPNNLTAVSTGSPGRVNLGWDPVLTANLYNLEWMAVDGVNHGTASTVFTTSIYSGPSYEDAKFRVSASCPNGRTSSWSEWKQFPVSVPSTCNLSAPTNLIASGSCGGAGSYLCGYVGYSWTPVSGATGYEIESVVFNTPTGQTYPTQTFQPNSNPYYYNAYPSGITNPGWNVHFRIRTKCSNGSWSSFSAWSSTFAL